MENKSDKNENCLYCGTSLIGMCQLHKRKYCSTTCGNKYKLRQKKPEIQPKLWQHKPDVFESAMGMYWGGSGGAAIARYFNIPVGTVYSWIHDFGSQSERIEPMKPFTGNLQIKRPLKERFRAAESADEWLEALREGTLQSDDSFEDVNVNLVCGVLHGQSAGKLASVISESLKEDPLSGKSYAFCNKGRNTIAVIAWKDPVYHISKYVKVHGTFIWPSEKLGKTIEITKTEFERMFFIKKHEKGAKKFREKASETLISCGFYDTIKA